VTQVLKSPKLTSLLEDRDKLKARAPQSRAEVWRLTKQLSPQAHDATVSVVMDDDAPTRARIGLKGGRNEKGVVYTGGLDEQDEAARREDALKRTLAGDPLAESIDIKAQLEREHRQWSAIEDAIEFRNREIERERAVLAIQYCKELKPKHDDIMRKLSKSLLETHAAWLELFNLKRHLVDNEVGLRGLCLTLPNFLGAPNDKHNEMADFLNTAKRDSFIKEVPEELRQ
jgi:hypothetical protein